MRDHKNQKKSEPTLGDRMGMVRKAHGDAQDDVASFLHVTRAAVSQWEKDQTKPKLDKLKTFADHYNARIEWLMWEKGEPPNLPTPGKQRARASDLRHVSFLPSSHGNVTIREIDNATTNWSIPARLFNTRSLAVLQTNFDAPPFKAGDCIFVDLSKNRINRQGYWLVETKKIGRLIVRSEVKVESDAIALSAGEAPLDAKAIKNIVGLIAGRLCLINS